MYNPSPLVCLVVTAAPGSQVHRQFHSLLATMVKLSSWGMLSDSVRLQLCGAAADAALQLLACAAKRQQQRQQQQQQQRQQQAKGATAAAAAAADGGGTFGCSNSNAAAMLPSVFLLGRCCMSFDMLLNADFSPSQQQQGDPSNSQDHQQQQQQQEGPNSSLEQRQLKQQLQQQQGDHSSSQDHQQLQLQQQEDPSSSHEQQPHPQGRGNSVTSKLDLSEVWSVVQQWLQAGSTCDQLAAAGYAPQAVVQQLEQVSAAWQNMQLNPSDTAALLAAAQELKSTGLALCSFAVSGICNNPGCTSLLALSELASVSGRSHMCAGCHAAWYCGRACQRAAWKQHKPVCQALSAAAGCGAGSGKGC
jgi:hypothetical protein